MNRQVYRHSLIDILREMIISMDAWQLGLSLLRNFKKQIAQNIEMAVPIDILLNRVKFMVVLDIQAERRISCRISGFILLAIIKIQNRFANPLTRKQYSKLMSGGSYPMCLTNQFARRALSGLQIELFSSKNIINSQLKTIQAGILPRNQPPWNTPSQRHSKIESEPVAQLRIQSSVLCCQSESPQLARHMNWIQLARDCRGTTTAPTLNRFGGRCSTPIHQYGRQNSATGKNRRFGTLESLRRNRSGRHRIFRAVTRLPLTPPKHKRFRLGSKTARGWKPVTFTQ